MESINYPLSIIESLGLQAALTGGLWKNRWHLPVYIECAALVQVRMTKLLSCLSPNTPLNSIQRLLLDEVYLRH